MDKTLSCNWGTKSWDMYMDCASRDVQLHKIGNEFKRELGPFPKLREETTQ